MTEVVEHTVHYCKRITILTQGFVARTLLTKLRYDSNCQLNNSCFVFCVWILSSSKLNFLKEKHAQNVFM